MINFNLEMLNGIEDMELLKAEFLKLQQKVNEQQEIIDRMGSGETMLSKKRKLYFNKSLGEMAELVGCHKNTLGYYERGMRSPGFAVLRNIIKYYELSDEELHEYIETLAEEELKRKEEDKEEGEEAHEE